MARAACSVAVLLALVAVPRPALAQGIKGVVVDQTGLPLPGATIQIVDGQATVETLITEADGTFVIDALLPGDAVLVTLEGFERRASRAVTPRASSWRSPVSPRTPPSSPRPPSRLLLPRRFSGDAQLQHRRAAAVVADESEGVAAAAAVGDARAGWLMQLGGARAHDTPLLLDGFNITDPATGISSLNLPFETVRGVDVLRDPMAVATAACSAA